MGAGRRRIKGFKCKTQCHLAWGLARGWVEGAVRGVAFCVCLEGPRAARGRRAEWARSLAIPKAGLGASVWALAQDQDQDQKMATVHGTMLLCKL